MTFVVSLPTIGLDLRKIQRRHFSKVDFYHYFKTEVMAVRRVPEILIVFHLAGAGGQGLSEKTKLIT